MTVSFSFLYQEALGIIRIFTEIHKITDVCLICDSR